MPEAQPTTGFDASSLWQYDLIRGRSERPASGGCFMDAVSWFTYGHLGDEPICVGESLATYGRIMNDRLDDGPRQALKAYIPRMVNTRVPQGSRSEDGYLKEREAVECGRIEAALWFTLGHMLLPALMRANTFSSSLSSLSGQSRAFAAAAAPHSDALQNAIVWRDLKEVARQLSKFVPRVDRAFGCECTSCHTGFDTAPLVGAASAMVKIATERTRRGLLVAAVQVAQHAAALVGREPVDLMMACLDRMLAIGPQAEPPPVGRMQAANGSFEAARADDEVMAMAALEAAAAVELHFSAAKIGTHFITHFILAGDVPLATGVVCGIPPHMLDHASPSKPPTPAASPPQLAMTDAG